MWGDAITATNNLIERHVRLARKTFVRFYQVTCCVFKADRQLKLDDIYKFHVCVQTFKALKQNKNPLVASSIESIFPSHDYATRNQHRMIVIWHRKDAFKMNFKFTFINIWKNIESDKQEARTLRIFKNKLFAF